MTQKFAIVLPLLLVVFGSIGCAPAEINEAAYDDEALITSATLYYEGSCNYLRQCSTWSRAAGRVLWGCESIVPALSTQACYDSDLWVAAPSSEYCGIPIRICTSRGCVDAPTRDISDASAWEGSPEVMRRLGFTSFGESVGSSPPATCSGWGTYTATVYTGTWGSLRNYTLAPGGRVEIYYTGRVGNNAIEYLNQRDVPIGGRIQHCWRRGTGVWSCWATDDVGYRSRRRVLYSGSSDINYRFTITNTASRTVQFFWRTYTAW